MDGYSSDYDESNRLAVTNGFGLFHIDLRVKYLPFSCEAVLLIS